MDKNSFLKQEIPTLVWNLFIVLIAYSLCRVVYWAENYDQFSYLSYDQWTLILSGAWKFDLSATLYTNLLLIILFSIPCHLKWRLPEGVGKGIFVGFNSVALLSNLSDAVYFNFTGRRSTATVFQEFSNEGNLTSIFLKEFVNHWYLVLFAGLIVFLLIKLYKSPDYPKKANLFVYYPTQLILFVLVIFLTVNGMRGGFGSAVRPITISNANQYASKPSEAALVLNTPFSIIRTIGKKAFVTPEYYTQEELEQIYQPLHTPSDSVRFMPKNVVVLIVESFAKEYIGALNKDLENGNYHGYTPFVDSLIQHSLTFEYSYSNGRKSIDGMPSILSSIPMFVEPFFLTPASMNKVSGIAGELDKKGYYTAFFHGAQNGSMGFQAFAKATGFKDYFGRTEFNEDNRYRGDADFDGTWAIWDEPFLQFYCDKMTEFKEPFMTAVFTASSHHPFVVPEQYKEIFPEEQLVIHKCIRYTDNALRLFFEKAKKEAWYNNTLFVITADHSNLTNHAEYQTDLGAFSVPIIFYDPSGNLPIGTKNAIAQQIDIMPTVLGYLGYDQPYIAFGVDLLHTSKEELFAVNYSNGIYQYVKNDYMIQFDGKNTTGVYALTDRLQQHSIINKLDCQSNMESELKAIIQQYMYRMNQDQLVVSSGEDKN